MSQRCTGSVQLPPRSQPSSWLPAAFKILIDRFDGNTLPSATNIANILFSYAKVPESWKDRTAGIFLTTAEILSVIDDGHRLRYDVAIKQATLSQGEQPPPVPNETPSATTKLRDPNPSPVVQQQPPAKTATIAIPSSNMNVWKFTQCGSTVCVETPDPLPRGLWERLTGYIALLEPPQEQPGKGGSHEEG